jgi:TfoX/Sxy family transcriptional regulator of competence genes
MTKYSREQLQDQLSKAAESLGIDTDLTFRPMFGGITGYYQGRNFASLSNIGLALKLPTDAQDELLQIEGAKRLQYEPDAPVSKQSVVVPEEMLSESTKLAAWVKRSTDHVLTLPAPKPKTKKA